MVVPKRMTEANEQEQKRPLTLGGGTRLELRRPVETGQVRQSFSHGRSKTVTVASLTLVIPAGQTVKVTLKPNATGRSLLARFHRLPVHLTAILEGQSGRTTVIAQNLTIKPKPKPHHRRRH